MKPCLYLINVLVDKFHADLNPSLGPGRHLTANFDVDVRRPETDKGRVNAEFKIVLTGDGEKNTESDQNFLRIEVIAQTEFGLQGAKLEDYDDAELATDMQNVVYPMLRVHILNTVELMGLPKLPIPWGLPATTDATNPQDEAGE